ncbi:MAG: formate/nitrite transporter family protein [Lachnospiraceae bacterium]|jgi:nitrite transporter NirC
MFKDEMMAVCNAAQGKMKLLRENLPGYVIASFMAGLYIALGCIFMGVVGGYLSAANSPATKLVSGLVFSIGLCCVTMAGAELFTGNNFVMTAASLRKAVSWGDTVTLWIVCYLGNLAGSVVAAGVFTMTGIPGGEVVGTFFANGAAAKVSDTVSALFAKGILCNICVCVAVWCGIKMKTEAAKLVMNFCCISAFVACGFEHSVGNMTYLTIALLNPMGVDVTISGVIYNLAVVTVGNIVGGALFVAVPYYIIAKNKEIAG